MPITAGSAHTHTHLQDTLSPPRCLPYTGLHQHTDAWLMDLGSTIQLGMEQLLQCRLGSTLPCHKLTLLMVWYRSIQLGKREIQCSQQGSMSLMGTRSCCPVCCSMIQQGSPGLRCSQQGSTSLIHKQSLQLVRHSSTQQGTAQQPRFLLDSMIRRGIESWWLGWGSRTQLGSPQHCLSLQGSTL